MRLFLLTSLALLAACGHDPVVHIPPDLLTQVPGYEGPVPQTEGALIAAAVAEKRGRLEANSKLAAIAEIVSQSFP